MLSRLGYALSHSQPWGASRLAHLRPLSTAVWTETWRDPAERVREVEAALRAEGGIVRRGGDFDRWDLEVRWSGFGSGRVLLAVEEHSGGHQLVRVRAWPACALRRPLLQISPRTLEAARSLGASQPWQAICQYGPDSKNPEKLADEKNLCRNPAS